MSQYRYNLPDKKVVLWGKDDALGWFLDLYKSKDIDVDSVISEKSTIFDGLTEKQMKEELLRLGVPEKEIR